VLDRSCPDCSFDASAIARHAVGAMLRTNVEAWYEVLSRGELVRQRPPRRPDGGVIWSALEYGCHVRDVYVLFDERLRLMLTQQDPTFLNWDQDATAIAKRYWEDDPMTVREALREAGHRLADVFDQVRDNLPDEIEAPELRKFDPNQFPVVILGARSNRPLDEVTRLLEREIVRNFEQIPGVGVIDVWGGVHREVKVDLIRERLTAYELTASDVVGALGRENVNLPGGNVREGLSDLYVRSIGEFQSVPQIADTVVSMVDGNPIRVRDVAHVEFGYEDIGRYTEIEQLPAVRLAIRKQSGANTVAVAAEPSTRLPTAPMPRVPMAIMSQPSSLARRAIVGATSPTLTSATGARPALRSAVAASSAILWPASLTSRSAFSYGR